MFTMLNIETVVVPTSPVTLKDENLLNDKSNDSFRKMQETPNQQVKHNKIAARSGKPIDQIDRTQSDNCSERERDEESICLDRSRIDETGAEYSKSDVDDNASNDDAQSGEEIKEGKAVRVGNVMTDIQFPVQYMDVNTMYGINDARRQKRKQNIPHQHEQTTKIRRLDGPHYEEELWNLRHHLSAVQNYFRHYDVTHPKLMNGFESSMDNINQFNQANFANLTAMHNEQLQKESNVQNRTLMAAFDRKIPNDNDSFNIAKHVRETVNANKGLAQSVAELNEKDLNEFIGSMKSKIEEAVSVTVDEELLKFFQKRNINTTNDSSTVINKSPKQESNSTSKNQARDQEKRQTTDHSLNHILQMPDRHNTINSFRLPERHSAFELPKLSCTLPELPRNPFPHHPPLGYPPLSFYLPTSFHPPPMYSCPLVPPEQTEALALVVNTQKKKRTKVTDTRLSPRAARALLQENGSMGNIFDHDGTMSARFGQLNHQCLPTSVAIPNPSLQHADILNYYKENGICTSPSDNDRNTPCSSNSPSENGYSFLKGDFFSDSEGFDAQGKQITLTPMHLRKAKLMFFYVRYPSSAILKAYFPDVQFNKNNTAQLVKWFSNFREFYYIQMEKYARQAITDGCKHGDDCKHGEGCKHTEELVVTADSELYRVLNLHYNRNNQIEVPENFRITVQATLREFYLALLANKDAEPSWKKPIYKVIARIDDVIPEYFKSPNWMDQLGES